MSAGPDGVQRILEAMVLVIGVALIVLPGVLLIGQPSNQIPSFDQHVAQARSISIECSDRHGRRHIYAATQDLAELPIGMRCHSLIVPHEHRGGDRS